MIDFENINVDESLKGMQEKEELVRNLQEVLDKRTDAQAELYLNEPEK